ncbi:hypothetical protein QBC43DRAFT_315356 [Cladorrhinum sp. PSN259]|nr:hypothetical protein QBC43DRAFT_315356 [Cladorrhinum sp. PSN259]
MKTAFTILVLPLLAFANPVPEMEADIEKRSYTCSTTGSNLKYHRKPSTSSTADGEFGAKGTKVVVQCWTAGTCVNDNCLWWKIASGTGKGDYVTDYYINNGCAENFHTKC